MTISLESKPKKFEKPRRGESKGSASGASTQIGWQSIRFTLPPEWNLTGFSMDHDNGYLRVDAPGDAALTVQVRWMNAAKPQQPGPPNLYSFAAPRVRKWLKRPEPAVPKPDLTAILERFLRDTAKQARKAKAKFDSTLKPERTEGPSGERTSLGFAWTGEGRGQGKIWHCATCNRVVVAQVVGLQKDQSAIANIAGQLFATLQDHALDGYDRWALYDLQIDVPDDFRLEAQKLLSGHLHLEWGRQAERIVVDRWGLANMTLKRFTPSEWLRNNALVRLSNMSKDEEQQTQGHEATGYAGSLSSLAMLRALRESKGALRRFPSRYEGGIWNCPVSNKLFAIQTLHNRRTQGLWQDVASRCVCHTPAQAEDYDRFARAQSEQKEADEALKEVLKAELELETESNLEEQGR